MPELHQKGREMQSKGSAASSTAEDFNIPIGLNYGRRHQQQSFSSHQHAAYETYPSLRGIHCGDPSTRYEPLAQRGDASVLSGIIPETFRLPVDLTTVL
jgi:hypothetical protein